MGLTVALLAPAGGAVAQDPPSCDDGDNLLALSRAGPAINEWAGDELVHRDSGFVVGVRPLGDESDVSAVSVSVDGGPSRPIVWPAGGFSVAPVTAPDRIGKFDVTLRWRQQEPSTPVCEGNESLHYYALPNSVMPGDHDAPRMSGSWVVMKYTGGRLRFVERQLWRLRPLCTFWACDFVRQSGQYYDFGGRLYRLGRFAEGRTYRRPAGFNCVSAETGELLVGRGYDVTRRVTLRPSSMRNGVARGFVGVVVWDVDPIPYAQRFGCPPTRRAWVLTGRRVR